MANSLTDWVHGVPDVTFVITPNRIDTSQKTLREAFGNPNSDSAACWLILYMQQQGKGWIRFTQNDVDDLSKNNELGYSVNLKFHFFTLITDGYIKYQDGYYYLTEGFITRAFLANPKG